MVSRCVWYRRRVALTTGGRLYDHFAQRAMTAAINIMTVSALGGGVGTGRPRFVIASSRIYLFARARERHARTHPPSPTTSNTAVVAAHYYVQF